MLNKALSNGTQQGLYKVVQGSVKWHTARVVQGCTRLCHMAHSKGCTGLCKVVSKSVIEVVHFKLYMTSALPSIPATGCTALPHFQL